MTDDLTADNQHRFGVFAVPPFSPEFRIGQSDTVEGAMQLAATAEESDYQPVEYRLKREPVNSDEGDAETEPGDRHPHTEQIKGRFPAPLCYMLIELAEMNRDKWLDGETWRRDTIGAEDVMKYGLTENQRLFANQIAEQMEVDHDAYR